MNIKSLETLEYDKIREWLAGFARTEFAKEEIGRMVPSTNTITIERRLNETTEARHILDCRSSVPIHSLTGIEGIMMTLEKGGVLTPNQCEAVGSFLNECQKLIHFMASVEECAPTLASWCVGMDPLLAIQEEIAVKITCGEVDDAATSELQRLNKAMQKTDNRIKTKIEGLMRSLSQKNVLQEEQISQRNGRYVLAVKSSQWRSVSGSVRDRSASGSTTFVEPEEVRLLQDELDHIRLEIEVEKERILHEISALCAEKWWVINQNKDAMIQYDLVIARGRLSRAMSGRAAKMRKDDRVIIRNGRHPLLGDKAVPLQFELPERVKGLVITGPNTGGKTVVLKTVGLFVAMHQSGLHVPAEEGTAIGLFENILADIGDGQSIAQNLSTFSAHMKTISGIIEEAGPRTLVLLDEMGSGTDPTEGMGLAVAILEALQRKAPLILATTHFAEIKRFGAHRSGFINGAMGFDLETLSPKYVLTIGVAGQSHGLHIAQTLGIPMDLIERAREVAQMTDEEEDVLVMNYVPEKTSATQEVEEMVEEQAGPMKYVLGDAVKIPFMNEMGIVVETEDRKGNLVIQVHGKRLSIGKKRLKPYISAEELYPEGYDMDIVTQSKDYRKAKKKVSKGKVGVVLTHK